MGSKYGKVLLDIENQIRTGELLPGVMLPTEKQYMDKYEVSRTTIQRAMNILVEHNLIERIPGKGTFVKKSEELPQKRITEKIKFSMILPYRSNLTIGYFVGAQKVLEQKGAFVSVRFCEENSESEIAAILSEYNSGTNGILFYPQEFPQKSNYLMGATMDIPIVTLDKRITEMNLSGAGSDNMMGGEIVAKYLVDREYNNFAFVSTPFYQCNTTYERFVGFKKYLKFKGISLDKKNICMAANDSEKRKEQIFSFIEKSKGNYPLAIFCSTDELASYVYSAASLYKIKIPQEIAVIGYDDLELSRFLIPPLTTVKQEYEAIGEIAAKLLWDKYEYNNSPVTYVELPVSIVERGSVQAKACKYPLSPE